MSERIDLIWLSQDRTAPKWSLGQVWVTKPLPSSLHHLVEEKLPESEAVAWLFWDATLGEPKIERIQEALNRPGDLWHAGLRLGMSGPPGLMDFVNPTWMLNCDPDKDIEATSWRLSLQACLVRTDVLRQMGGPKPTFLTLAGASLEMGHRYITRGVLTRHLPWLLEVKAEKGIDGDMEKQGKRETDRQGNGETEMALCCQFSNSPIPRFSGSLPFEDELRFVYYRFGRFWTRWALMRAVMSRYVPLSKAFKAWRSVKNEPRPPEPAPYTHPSSNANIPSEPKVSVLIPTIDRYPYLRTLLNQLRQQTVKPLEIIIVDQTPLERRETSLADEFNDLPLRIIYRDQPGQCSSRNAGLYQARGDFILFLDDDEEVPPTLIEDHLKTLERFQADVSSGVADEVGAGPLPEAFTYLRVSDVFPMGNTLIRKDVLYRSGLFDLAYERGQRADGDLGMRVYLSGALMVLNPNIRILHHHAPRGGLRVHKARVITYASSRKYITHRHLPSVTEIYLAKRYFKPRQVREELWLRALGTLSLRGPWWKRLLKIILGTLLLPDTWWKIRCRYFLATEMFKEFPQIPTFKIGGD